VSNPQGKEKLSIFCDCGEKAEHITVLEVSCKKCSWVRRIPVTLKATAIAALLGYVGSQLIDYAITDNRYPIKTEYAVMKSCVNSYARYMSVSEYRKKEEICVCALTDTMNEISYIREKFDEKGFLRIFRENIQKCGE